MTNSAVLIANLPNGVNCPTNHGTNGNACRTYSVPVIDNDIITGNRSFVIGVGGFGSGVTSQQKVVTLNNAFGSNTTYTPFPGSPAISQTTSGDCNDTHASYWDIGVRGDTSPANHAGGTLAPQYSFIDNAAALYGTASAHNNGNSPSLTTLYCDGSRVPPEAANGSFSGWQVPPGTNESNALPGPVFSLLPSATVDEGNNWVNLQWGPLAMTNPATGTALANFNPTSTSGVIDYIPSTAGGANGAYTLAPGFDFYGNRRKVNSSAVDAGAIEVTTTLAPPTVGSVSPNSGTRGTVVNVTITGTNFTSGSAVTVSGGGIAVSNVAFVDADHVTATFTISALASTTARNVTVQTAGGTATANNAFTVLSAVPTVTGVSPNSGLRGTVVQVTITGTNFGTNPLVTAGFGGVSVSNVSVNGTGTQITATFTISTTATISARDVRVTTLNGISAANASDRFTVQGPTLASISPNPATRGSNNLTLTFTGTNLSGATGVTGLGNGVTVVAGSFAVVDSTHVTVRVNIAAGASLTTTRNAAVTTNIGTTNTVLFTLQ